MKRCHFSRLNLGLAAAALACAFPGPLRAGTGYLENGDFEEGALKPWNWFAAGGAKATGELDTQEKHSGEFSCRIHNESPQEPNVYGQLRQYAYALKANTAYVITAWVKGNDVRSAQLALGPEWKIIERLPNGTFDWTEVRKEFTTGDAPEKYDVVFIAGSTTEALWIDDVKIQEAGEKSASVYEPSPWRGVPASAKFYPIFQTSSAKDAPVLSLRSTDQPLFGGDIQITCSQNSLLFKIRVFQPSAVRGTAGSGMWNSDSVQLAIDAGAPQTTGGSVNTYYELGFTMASPTEAATHAWDGNFDWSTAKIHGNLTKEGYDLTLEIPWRSLGYPAPPASFGLNIVINHKGDDNARHFVEWTPGTAKVKNRDVFARAIPAISGASIVQDLSLDHRRYTPGQIIHGRWAAYSREGASLKKMRLGVFSPDKTKVWSSDWMDMPQMAADTTQTVNFSLPVELLGPDGDYEIRLQEEDGRTEAAAPLRVENLEKRIAAETARIDARTAKAEEQWSSMPEKRDDAYLGLGFSVIHHFMQRLASPGEGSSPEWRMLQVEELGRVLDSIERRLAAGNPTVVLPPIDPAPVSARDGVLLAKRGDATTPAYFYGYGHFSTVAKDIPLLAKLGANLIQQEEGPRALDKNGQLAGSCSSLFSVFQTAAANNVKIDFLLAPHYFPESALEEFGDLRLGKSTGFIKFNIDHPAARKIVGDWIAAIVPPLAASPALLSVCLSNEPTYSESGRDAYSRKDWVLYLERKHGSVAALNALYGTAYTAFDEVPTPAIASEKSNPRAYYDWIRFNQQHFAAWHQWLNDRVKAAAPQVLTHAKIMTDIFDRQKLSRGIDPELICNITDLAGNDSYAWPNPYGNYAYNWRQVAMWYDLLHSFKGQPVFNSENHLVLDGSPPVSISPEHSRCVLWQGAIHHLAASATWVWEKPTAPDLIGSVYMRPANIFSMGEAMLDLARLSKEVAGISEMKAEVALLYSVPSLYWDERYPEILASAYTALTFMGHPVTFISEAQLIEGRRSPANENISVIISPGARHVSDGVNEALVQFQKKSGLLLTVSEGNLQYDEYDRPRTLDRELAKATHLSWKKGQDERFGVKLRAALGDSLAPIPCLSDASGKPAWGLEYRVLKGDGYYLVAITNFSNKPKVVSLPLDGPVSDLITSAAVNPKEISIDPLQYMLLRISVR